MAKTTGDYLIPFDKEGNMLHYPGYTYEGVYPNHKRVECPMHANVDVALTLQFDGFHRGRSAAYLQFKDAGGRTYPMFLKEFSEAVVHMVRGELRGTFRGIKRGQNYGLNYVGSV